ncbi:MAG: class I fructose-bisphosphate aldolase [Candidatus Nanogingivalis sp.]
MNPSILSIGNATKDIFLEIGDEKIHKDEQNLFHYDLTFDDSTLEYQRKAGIFGGVILSEKIFQAAHLKSFSNVNPRGLSNYNFDDPKINFLDRYIISHQEQSSVLSNKPRKMQWVAPIFVPETIYVADANFSKNYLESFRNYLKNHPEITLIFSLNDFSTDLAREFFHRASLVFVDLNQPVLSDIIDYSSVESAVKSFCDLGVRSVVFTRGKEIIVGNNEKIAQIETDFKLNSFYQSQIFRAAYIAEDFMSSDIEQNLKTAAVIAGESDFNNILKPVFANQILKKKSDEYSVEVLRKDENLLEKMQKVAKDLVAKPKGIFAADESGGNIHKKFESLGIDDTAENRRKYREMFFTTPDIENYLSGVILFEETIEQSTSSGENFVDYLKSRGLLTGVKLDGGLQPLAGFDGETIAVGLDSLEEKLKKYSSRGLDFAKWRVAFTIDVEKDYPSRAAIAANVQILARYAKLCQNYGIVPIVEPEVIFDGNHSAKDCRIATGRILLDLFDELKLFEVDLTATILKVNMVLAGKNFELPSSPREVASETVNVLKKCVPKELAGIVFLSGGQTVQQATDNLQAITNLGPFDWGVTYSYARALQEPAMKAWAGKDENVRVAQLAFMDRVSANSHALYKN